MLLINIHELQIILADAIILAALKHQVENIRRVLGLEREDILVLRGAKDFGEGGEVYAEGDVAVASKGGKGFGFEHHGHEGDVGVVHGL